MVPNQKPKVVIPSYLRSNPSDNMGLGFVWRSPVVIPSYLRSNPSCTTRWLVCRICSVVIPSYLRSNPSILFPNNRHLPHNVVIPSYLRSNPSIKNHILNNLGLCRNPFLSQVKSVKDIARVQPTILRVVIPS